MDNNALGYYFDQWRLKQPPNRIFEWGTVSVEGDCEPIGLVSKRFDDMSLEEQRMVWEFKVWPAISAIE